MANKDGKKFEDDFKKSVPDSWTCLRLKDAGGWSNAENTRFTVKNVCDFILFDTHCLFLLELKSHLGVSIPAANFRQLDGLLKYQGKQNCSQYFVLNYRKYNETYIMELQDIQDCLRGRKSVPVSLCRERGVKLPQTIKRTRYRYDLTVFNKLIF